MSTTFSIDTEDFERLQEALKNFKGDSEQAINEVLHGEGSTLIEKQIRLLIPESGKTWKGKGAPAKSGNSLRAENSNLAVTTKSTKKYGYLYFPDNGSNTRRHAGNQHFFLEGAENASGDIIDLCIENIIHKFEEGD